MVTWRNTTVKTIIFNIQKAYFSRLWSSSTGGWLVGGFLHQGSKKLTASIHSSSLFRRSAAIILKYYIHTCKVRKCIPYFSVFTKKIITTESTELNIATKNGKTKQHLDKWGDVITKFSFWPSGGNWGIVVIPITYFFWAKYFKLLFFIHPGVL